ncbi:hypothetical protein [Streptomyces sp. CoH17]|uniref:hypothetical protein n=1 Tax=Streptomyces sp. CoH17 TaxID=2992806 RepID=UPI00226F10DD|nr:hypothetical protein [Streptomyces sp. CoH17]
MKKTSPELVAEMVEWYTSQESPPTIAETMSKFGLSRDSVRRYLIRNGVTLTKGTRKGSKRGSYDTGPKPVKKCPCGKEVHYGKYCSPECFDANGGVGRRPSGTRTAVCLGCGNEFSRPGYYPTKMLYCSNKCAKSEQKKGWSKVGLETDLGLLVLRSGYEIRFLACCLRFGVQWRSYDGPDIETSLGTYRPDFIVSLGGVETVIEVKGWNGPDAVTKVAEAIEQGVNLLLVDQGLLETIEQVGFKSLKGV